MDRRCIYKLFSLISMATCCAESSRAFVNQNFVVRKQLFSDQVGAEKEALKSRPVPPFATTYRSEQKQLPAVSPLYPAGAAPVAGLQSRRMGNDGTAPLLDKTSSSFDSDSGDEGEWLKPLPTVKAVVGPAAARPLAAQGAHQPAEVTPMSERDPHSPLVPSHHPLFTMLRHSQEHSCDWALTRCGRRARRFRTAGHFT